MGFLNFQDQIGSFLGGASDVLEDRYNSLSVTGRQQIAQLWRKDMVALGRNMLRGKPGDIRAVLESPLMAEIDGEEQGKLMRLALEAAKIDDFLGGDYSEESLKRLASYKTALALEQDASSSGAQIIALTTRNRQLAELSNVVPTNQKQRLYDEIAAATFNDPRFIELNKRLNLTEKDLRKAAKAYFWALKNPVNSVKLLLKKDNTEPSLPWEGFEGVTTKVYDLEQIMKLVGQKSARSAGQMIKSFEEIVWTTW
jgi:hypothetical protein